MCTIMKLYLATLFTHLILLLMEHYEYMLPYYFLDIVLTLTVLILIVQDEKIASCM